MKHFAALAGLLGLLGACSADHSATDQPGRLGPPDPGGAYAAPPVGSFPADAATVNRWVHQQDMPAIRAHAWDIWQSINTLTPDSLPVWETWYSGHELFERVTSTRTVVHDFNSPVQFFHASVVKQRGVPSDPAEMPISFNRYSPSLANFIWTNRLYDSAVLGRKYRAVVRSGAPLAQRGLLTSKDSVDQASFALKPVFQFIRGDSASVVPYWAGIAPGATTDLDNPEPHTWRQCVVVDPTGRLRPGTTARMSCNGEPPRDWPVVSLKDFYSIKITAAEAANYSKFAEESGDEIGRGNLGDTTAIKQLVKTGNYALLTGMHVTGKEISNWTWQTFWWSPNGHDAVFGNDRPKSLPAPWNHYNMLAAYYMVAPAGTRTGGQPLIVFNPYLETNLTGKVANGAGSKDSTQWYGVFSNCMSCHRLAAWPLGQYTSSGYIDPGDPAFFTGNLKTDFLWSVATRARPVSPAQLKLLRQLRPAKTGK
ncbi:hypothetical protein LJ737_01815 [Hymenobacter sp. 15J16-1T3B]|uniref:hypothetical protein n=1 Tax=Hymenobacter sp. 15J16-1T3B TaxID=2886941 RepID=UPI001D129C5D|nr:hypothetical protein [Hymenobacter sp. 15J16-1T3B]MCC3155955.1 hypothetical protein [Hymenobacter sp. 15J16-1T3B]